MRGNVGSQNGSEFIIPPDCLIPLRPPGSTGVGYDEELALGVDVLKLIKHINGLFFFVKNRLVYFLTSFSLTALLLLAPVKMKQKNCISRSHLHAVTAKANTDSVNKQLNLFTKKKKKNTSKITHVTNDLFNNENRRDVQTFEPSSVSASISISEALKLTISFFFFLI